MATDFPSIGDFSSPPTSLSDGLSRLHREAAGLMRFYIVSPSTRRDIFEAAEAYAFMLSCGLVQSPVRLRSAPCDAASIWPALRPVTIHSDAGHA
jgi:hypothetical protein